jgi:hypothetical protein
MDDRPEENRLFFCLRFVLDDIPLGEGGGGDFITPLEHNWHLEGCLLSNALPPFFGRISEEGGNLSPPPTSKVKEKLIKFPKEQIELTFVASYGKDSLPNMHHPTIESRWWWCILNVWFNLGKGEI